MKLKRIFLISLFSVLLLSGCGKKDDIKNPLDSDLNLDIQEMEISTPTPEPKKVNHEDTEAYKLFEEDMEESNEYVVYHPYRAGYVIKSTHQYTKEEVNLEFLINSYTKNRSLGRITINNFEFNMPEEKVSYHNGVPSYDYDEEFIAYLDLDNVFQDYIDSQTTPLGEWYQLYSFVDTLCNFIGCQGIILTTNGEPFHTMRYSWSENEPIYFSTKISEYLDKVDGIEEIEFSKIIESYIDLGYNISRENYISFWNATEDFDEDILSNFEMSEENEENINIDSEDNIEIEENKMIESNEELEDIDIVEDIVDNSVQDTSEKIIIGE